MLLTSSIGSWSEEPELELLCGWRHVQSIQAWKNACEISSDMVSSLNRRSNCRAVEEPVLRGQEGSSRVLWNPSVTYNARCTTLLSVSYRRKGCPPLIGSLAVSWGFPVLGMLTTISTSWKRKGGLPGERGKVEASNSPNEPAVFSSKGPSPPVLPSIFILTLPPCF